MDGGGAEGVLSRLIERVRVRERETEIVELNCIEERVGAF